MTDTRRVYEAYAQGHKDACQDTDCVLRPDSTYPSYGQGWADGFATARAEAELTVRLVGSRDDEMSCGCIPYEHEQFGPCTDKEKA